MAIARITRFSFATAEFGDTLTHDLASGFPGAATFFPHRDWREVVRQIDQKAYPRAEVAAKLRSAARRAGAPQPVLQNLDKLAQPRTYVVATGQQAGFLGGPLYSLLKALSAIKLAQHWELEAHGAAHFVPLFWVAGDDHDLAEIDHADFVEDNGSLARVRATFTPESLGCSAADAYIEPGQLAVLSESLRRLPSGAGCAEWLEAYRAHSMAEAFTALMYQWLGKFGLIIASSVEMRAFGRELFWRELDDYDITARLIQESALRLKRANYKPGFTQFKAAPHLFIAHESSRIRARIEPREQNDGNFVERAAAFEQRQVTARTYTKAQLRQQLESSLELFSPSAALRPVLQQKALPVAGCILGPGEISYWAQLKEVHEHFGAVFPVVLPRASLTLLNARAEKSLRKLGLDSASPDLFLDAQSLRKKIVSRGQVAGRIHERAARIRAELAALAAEVDAVNAGLRPMFDKAQARVQHELERIAEKTQEAVKDREDAGADRAQYLSAMVRPRNSPQERVLTPAQFLPLYPALLDDLLQCIEPLPREHLVITLD